MADATIYITAAKGIGVSKQRKLKLISLIMAGMVLAFLIAVAGCNGGGTTGSNGGGGATSLSSSPDGQGEAIELELEPFKANYTSYVGKTVKFQAVVDSKTETYIIAGGVKALPADRADIEKLVACNVVEVTGLCQGLSGGVLTVTNSQIVFICADESGLEG